MYFNMELILLRIVQLLNQINSDDLTEVNKTKDD